MEQATHFETLFNKAGDYLETRAGLVKLRTVKKASDIVSVMLSKAVAIAIVMGITLMLSFALAFYLGDLLGKNYIGFLLVAGLYMLVGVVYHLFKDKWVKDPVGDAIIKQMTSK